VGIPSAPLPRLPAPEASPPAREPEESGPAASRDIFRYADQPAPANIHRPAATPRPPIPVPAEAALRLVGILRKGRTLQAVLALSGEVILAKVGERVGGFQVLSIDEESGVRLRDPDGQEVTLPVPP
jgi:Tfp pilus assembly protein PilP